MGADALSRRIGRRRILVSGLMAGVVGACLAGGRVAGAQPAPDSPFKGRLAKAVFLSADVGAALQPLAASAPAELRQAITDAVARAKQTEPALAPAGPSPAGPSPVAAARLGRRRPLAQGMVALIPTPEARAESITASDALLPAASPVEDAQGIGVALGLAEAGESYLKAHRDSPLTSYLYAYLMVQYRLAFERQVAAKAVEGQKASAKKYRTFRQRALGSADPLVKAVAEDVDAQLYLERPTPEHPRNFDPDACCRDKI